MLLNDIIIMMIVQDALQEHYNDALRDLRQAQAAEAAGSSHQQQDSSSDDDVTTATTSPQSSSSSQMKDHNSGDEEGAKMSTSGLGHKDVTPEEDKQQADTHFLHVGSSG
jgi:FKBP-type peptidyl-prolyl cis-trans isomerase